MRLNTVEFCEEYLGINLLPYQKQLTNLLDKMARWHCPISRWSGRYTAELGAVECMKAIYERDFLLEQVIDKEYIEGVYRGAKEVFCDGIYVKSDLHPCGWDFISFEDLECSADAFSVGIENYSISSGNYCSSEFEDNTVEEIIKKVGVDGWCFELSGVDALK